MDSAARTVLGGLEGLVFDNRFVGELPADPDGVNRRRNVKGAAYSRVQPKPAPAPKLVAYSREVAEALGLSEETCRSEQFTRVFSGSEVLPGMDPFAMCYGGHQFGHWAGQLGDGRAINLGQARAAGQSAQAPLWFLQLKGAGPTPYSRMADGFAVLRSSVREFLCSEAMFHLGVPTTRALSLVTTGEQVERDMFYDGNPKFEPGAVVCRVARSFTRFGNFEIAASRGDEDLLRKLAEYTLRNDFPHLLPASGTPDKDTYVHWIREVCRTTAEMVVGWMTVGFVHGVMNTDNMSILGETIDYGPYGWLENYDPNWTPNTTDGEGRRYAFGNQPEIAHWNLTRLASAVVPLVGETQPLQDAMGVYAKTFQERWQERMSQKLGFREFVAATDEKIIFDLLDVLQLAETDMTVFFRELGRAGVPAQAAGGDGDVDECLAGAYYDPGQLTGEIRAKLGAWLATWRSRVRQDGESAEARRARMDAVNPRFVLRNYLAQLAIDAAEKGDPSGVTELLEVLRRPYEEQPAFAKYAEKRPEWARQRPGCSMLSCSS